MRNYAFGLFCLLSAAILFGLVPQNPPILGTIKITEGIVQFEDAYGRAVKPLSLKHTVCLGSEFTEEVSIVEPKGTGSVACAYVGDYIVWAKGEMWGPSSNRTWDEIEETGDITVVATAGYITGDVLAYNHVNRQEPDSHEKPKVVLIRKPPAYLPPKRQSRFLL